MPSLKQVVEKSDTRAGLSFNLVVQGLIVISLITFSLETLPRLSPEWRKWLYAIEVVTVLFFTVEYVLRLAVADSKRRFVFSFFGLIDLVAILPFYLALGIDLRAVRAFRLLRLFRILKVARYSKAIQRYHRALLIAREELVLYACVTMMLFYLSAVGIYYFENEAQPEVFSSVFSSLWWSVVTLTTVGYGDTFPLTVGGRIFTFFVLILGLGVVTVPAGIVASALSKSRELEEVENADE